MNFNKKESDSDHVLTVKTDHVAKFLESHDHKDENYITLYSDQPLIP